MVFTENKKGILRIEIFFVGSTVYRDIKSVKTGSAF